MDSNPSLVITGKARTRMAVPPMLLTNIATVAYLGKSGDEEFKQ